VGWRWGRRGGGGEGGGGGGGGGGVDCRRFIDVKQPPKNLFNNKEESENTARRELIRVGEPVKYKETKSPTTPAFDCRFEAMRSRRNNLIGYKKVILFLLMSVVPLIQYANKLHLF